MTNKTKTMIKILSLLNEHPVTERIEIIERIGKRLRQQNSIETAKEVQKFASKAGVKKDIDYSPILKNR
jgi:hypothetical protein